MNTGLYERMKAWPDTEIVGEPITANGCEVIIARNTAGENIDYVHVYIDGVSTSYRDDEIRKLGGGDYQKGLLHIGQTCFKNADEQNPDLPLDILFQELAIE